MNRMIRTLLPALICVLTCRAFPAPVVERLDRGTVAVHQPDGSVFISWRLLADDPDGVAFNIYRTTEARRRWGGGTPPSEPVRLNKEPLTAGTWFIDRTPSLDRKTSYAVRPVADGIEGVPGEAVTVSAEPRPYHSVPLRTPPGYTPNDASLGDLDGDGMYEIVLKQEQRPHDNSHSGMTGDSLLQAYRLDGTLLWTIHLGKNIREGAHYTQFVVIDLDGDGRAEVACKTADGTIDGTGKLLGNPDAGWRETGAATVATRDSTGAERTPDGFRMKLKGRIISGPEYLTVFDGLTGAELATTRYIPGRHPDTDSPTPEQLKAVWGDGYANRSDRFLAGAAYLDGKQPSLLFSRGYYARSVIAAWDYRDGKLTSRWVFDSDDHGPADSSNLWRGQGNHQLSVADLDDDGKQEVIFGAMVLDDDGTGLYTTGWGHGDALHVSDLNWDNPGQEVHDIQERFGTDGMTLRDGLTGKPLFSLPSVKAGADGEGPGRGNAMNIDPRFPGSELWAAGASVDGLYAADGTCILEKRPRGFPTNFGIWWDGDLLRELLDGNRIMKWNWQTEQLDRLLTAHTCTGNNGTKATPALSADLWGDWREELILRTRDNRELRIYTSPLPTPHRMVTLMQNPQYRMAIAFQNTGYNQPPHPDFALDESLPLPDKQPVEFPANNSQ